MEVPRPTVRRVRGILDLDPMHGRSRCFENDPLEAHVARLSAEATHKPTITSSFVGSMRHLLLSSCGDLP
jgi:hypothetical protein